MGSEGGRNAMHAWRVRIQTQDLLADICRFFPPTKKPAQRNFISPNEKMTVTYLFWQVEFEFGVFLGRRLIRFKEVTCFVKQVGDCMQRNVRAVRFFSLLWPPSSTRRGESLLQRGRSFSDGVLQPKIADGVRILGA